MSETAWLIETVSNHPVRYFCNDGDWCDNPNHAHRFPTADEAHSKMVTLQNYPSGSYRVAEHMWL